MTTKTGQEKKETTVEQKEREVKIMNGPGKWDLLIGLGEGKDVFFTLDFSNGKEPEKFDRVTVFSIRSKNRQEQTWIISCYVSSSWVTDSAGGEFRALYSTKSRQGIFLKENDE